jgi:hypothetical protein
MSAPHGAPITRYLSEHDLAARWGEHPNTVYARVRTDKWPGTVRTIQLGRQLRFRELGVEAYEEARRLTPGTLTAAIGCAPGAELGVPEGADVPDELGAAPDDGAPPVSEFGPRRPPVRRKAAA